MGFRSQGGSDAEQNLITLCPGCHASIEASRALERLPSSTAGAHICKPSCVLGSTSPERFGWSRRGSQNLEQHSNFAEDISSSALAHSDAIDELRSSLSSECTTPQETRSQQQSTLAYPSLPRDSSNKNIRSALLSYCLNGYLDPTKRAATAKI